jgi:aminoglycoside phosphotransferase (APT) family kinase protein
VSDDDRRTRLAAWFAAQLPAADDVWLEGLDRVPMGHSAETLALTLAWRETGVEHRRDVVVRVRPPAPGLLEPYDLRRQFDVLRALESTPVRAPRALWYEGTGDVLGREFYAMERLDGTVYERAVPDDLAAAPERLARMSRSLVEQLAAIHSIDLHASALDRLDALGTGADYLTHELDHWRAEVDRVRRGPLPALDRLHAELRERQPDQCPTVTLVHGDAKPGNFAFEHDEVSAVFDWEMVSVGDPLSDIGWAEFNWTTPTRSPTCPARSPATSSSSPTRSSPASRSRTGSGTGRSRATRWWRSCSWPQCSSTPAPATTCVSLGWDWPCTRTRAWHSPSWASTTTSIPGR